MHEGFYSTCIDIYTCTCKTHTINMHGIIQCHNTTNTYKSWLAWEQTHILCVYMWICVNVNSHTFILCLGGGVYKMLVRMCCIMVLYYTMYLSCMCLMCMSNCVLLWTWKTHTVMMQDIKYYAIIKYWWYYLKLLVLELQ